MKLVNKLNCSIDLYIANSKKIDLTINKLFKHDSNLDQYINKKHSEISKEVIKYKSKSLLFRSNDEDDVVDQILIKACRVGASDIHIESENNKTRIRYRVEGTLSEKQVESIYISNIIFRRLRILANLDILKDSVPQDGSFTFNFDENKYSMRLSLLPTNNGTSAVIRIATDMSTETLSLDKIVEDEGLKDNIKDFLIKREGLMLVTGPTGSGKTTLLYCALSEVNTPEVKIISVEDPVEANMDRICQVQVNKDIGLDFSDVLRSVLRQDPDVIMVGEIRDQETAAISFRSAITGHKVFSTLHAKSVKNTIERLLDLNIDNYIMSAALNIVIAQRLVRCLCQYCKQPHSVDIKYIKKLKKISSRIDDENIFYKAKGCFNCDMRGYSGRKAVTESLVVDDEMRKAIVAQNFTEFHQLVDKQLHGKTIFDKALDLAFNHYIDIYELLSLES